MSETVAPERAAARTFWHPGLRGFSLNLAGFLLVGLGGIALVGWAGRWPLLVGLLPGFPPMVANTALMFVGSGAALCALAASRPSFVTPLAAAVGSLALATLAEHIFGIDLHIDGAAAHAWAQDGFPYPGRPAPATALCFALAAPGLILLAGAAHDMRFRLAGLLGVVVIGLSAAAVLGRALGLDTLFVSYSLRGMALPTALGLGLLGASLHLAALRRELDDTLRGADRRMISVGTLMLVTVALATGLPIFVVVKTYVEATLAAGLRSGLDTEVRLIDALLKLRIERAAIVTTRPQANEMVRTLGRDPTNAEALDFVEINMRSFRSHGFSGLRMTLPDGQVIAEDGTFLTGPALAAPLVAGSGHALLWNDGYVLHSRFEFRDGGQLVGIVEAEQPLPQMQEAMTGGRALGESGELQLCQRRDQAIHCFPTRHSARPFVIALSSADDADLAVQAARGRSGLGQGRGRHGEQVIGAYAPVADLDLFAILKMDTAELYGPLRRDLERALVMVALVVFAGSLLFRALVRPMAAELVRAREISQGKSRAMERLHAFQRAVFDQAPDGILVADQDGRIVEANERMATLFGYPRDALHGKSIEELVPHGVRAEHHRHRAEFGRAPSTRTMSRDRTLHGQRADGSEFPIEVALAPMKSDEGSRVIAIVKDVTEARRAEQVVRDALREKDLLLGEIHHRVKNNLQIVHSLLDMQAGLTTDERAASALRDSQNRIQSMALIHQTLYQSRDFAKVDFGQFLDNLMSHLQASYGRSDLSLSSRSDSVSLAIDRAIPCGLIVNELVTNALKHAFPDERPGSIVIELRLLRGVDVEVAVIDDGVGIPDTLDLQALSSLGMQLVRVLTEQLRAELHIQRRDPTRIALTFPLE